jgi:hypothetical protein
MRPPEERFPNYTREMRTILLAVRAMKHRTKKCKSAL